MATSEPYTSKSSALKGVEAIKRNAAVAQIDDESGDDQNATATPRTPSADWMASSLRGQLVHRAPGS